MISWFAYKTPFLYSSAQSLLYVPTSPLGSIHYSSPFLSPLCLKISNFHWANLIFRFTDSFSSCSHLRLSLSCEIFTVVIVLSGAEFLFRNFFLLVFPSVHMSFSLLFPHCPLVLESIFMVIGIKSFPNRYTIFFFYRLFLLVYFFALN